MQARGTALAVIMRMSCLLFIAFIFTCGVVSPPAMADEYKTGADPQGREKSAKTEVLEAGAKLLQTDNPLEGMDVYLVGFHPMKEDPSHQMETHHFCRQVNEDFAQCALFDGNSSDANLNGIEYIISQSLFESLPKEEQQYWHPHNYEILSGQLVAPGLPSAAEKELMQGKMNSYGKTWHVWNTGSMGVGADKLPLGQPLLAWSFNRDGEAKPGLVERRDKELDINTDNVRRERQDLVRLAKPQAGVDTLQGQFSGPTQSIAGVVDKEAAAEDAEGAATRERKTDAARQTSQTSAQPR